MTDIIVNCEALLSRRNNKRQRRVGWIIKVVTVDAIVRCYKEENFDGPITVAEETATAHHSPFDKQNRINSTYNKSKETKVGSYYYHYQEQEHT